GHRFPGIGGLSPHVRLPFQRCIAGTRLRMGCLATGRCSYYSVCIVLCEHPHQLLHLPPIDESISRFCRCGTISQRPDQTARPIHMDGRPDAISGGLLALPAIQLPSAERRPCVAAAGNWSIETVDIATFTAPCHSHRLGIRHTGRSCNDMALVRKRHLCIEDGRSALSVIVPSG